MDAEAAPSPPIDNVDALFQLWTGRRRGSGRERRRGSGEGGAGGGMDGGRRRRDPVPAAGPRGGLGAPARNPS